MKVIDKDISKKDLFDKLSKISQSDLKKLNLNNNEINYLKHKILNDKLGLVLNFEEKDEFLDNHYFGLEEVKELHINPKDKNNHLLIEGDNYYALKTLQLSGIKVDVIYIDPPYNTGNKDFVYNDNFVEKDDQFKHSKWLSFMKKRLILAKELLVDDGVIFVSIDDNEQAYLKVLMDEIFGEQNFVSDIIWIKKRGPGGNTSFNYKIVNNKENIICFSKNINLINFNYLIHDSKKLKELDYVNKDEYFEERGFYKTTYLFRPSSTGSFQYNESLDYPILAPDGTLFKLHVNKNGEKKGCYTWGYEAYLEGNKLGFIECKKNDEGDWVAYRKQYQFVKFDPKSKQIIKIQAGQQYENVIDGFYSSNGGAEIIKIFGDKNLFDFPKPISLIKHILKIASKTNSLILDFFAGSGTTGQAVMELNEEDGGNRRFILCTNNENNIAKDITRERIYRVINGEGSKGQKIDWQYLEDKKSLKNNSVKYLTVKSINKYDGQYEEIDDMKKIYKNEFNKELSIKDFK